MLSADEVEVPNTYLRLFLRTLGQDAALLRGTGQTVESLDRLGGRHSLAAYATFLCNARDALADPAIGLRMGRITRLGHMHGPLSTALFNCNHMQDGLHLLQRYGPLRNGGVRPYLVDEGAYVGLDLNFIVGLGPGHIAVTEILMLAINSLIAVVSAFHARASILEFDYPQPAYAHRYPQAFTAAALRFGQPRLRILVPRERLLDGTDMESDPALRAGAIERLEQQLNRTEHQLGHADRVRLVFSNNPGHLWKLAEVAAHLNTSPRTLQRRLDQEGHGYQDLLDEWVRSQADLLLAEPHLSVESVASLLGYADISNFRQACRRWHGMPPGALRPRRRRRAGT